MEAEHSSPWARTTTRVFAGQLAQIAESFYAHGDELATETARHMGVTPTSVWLEVIFPSVWGFLSMYSFLKSMEEIPLSNLTAVEPTPADMLLDVPALKLLPANIFQSLILPDFSGYVLLRTPRDEGSVRILEKGLALCLLPFNLASIGALDILQLLAHGPMRVVAKLSEKVTFLRPHFERIFSPLLLTKALVFVEGGPEVGSWLAGRSEFDRIHLTGSGRTAAAVQELVGVEKLTCELGGVTPAIILPEVFQNDHLLYQAARQVAFGALANNGQHCVSYQVVMVPESQQVTFRKALALEMGLTVSTGASQLMRTLVDESAAARVGEMVEDARRLGALVNPDACDPQGRQFPVTLLNGITDQMRLFREEVFGPVVGIMSLPDHEFADQAVLKANQPALFGDLGASLFTSQPESSLVHKLAGQLKHGVVGINSYPGVAFATSLPWGAGPGKVSGRGWVHNYQFLAESFLQKVVLSAPLGRKGPRPFVWEDPWLPNVSGPSTLRFARSLVRSTLAFFKKQPLRLLASQSTMIPTLLFRELTSRRQDLALG